MIDNALFEYITKSTGHTMQEAADAMGISKLGLNRRLSGETEFHRSEMEAWIKLTGVKDPGRVFFPSVVAPEQQEEARA